MFNIFKIATVMLASILALTACSSEYEPDTTLPLHQQIQASGVTSYEGFMLDSDWRWAAFALCNYEYIWTDDSHLEHSTDVDQAMISLDMDDVWDEEERKTIARILFINKCPERINK